VSAGELVLILLALLLIIGFTALIVVLLRVHDTLSDLRSDVVHLRAQTGPLLDEMRTTTDEAKHTVDEARTDLERFDKVLGSAEAIGDAVGGRVARTAFSTPAIKVAGLAKGGARTWSRIRGKPVNRPIGVSRPDTADTADTADNVIDVRSRGHVRDGEIDRAATTERRRRRA